MKITGERSGEGEALRHRGRGPWSPATSGVSSGLWVPFVDIQSLRKAWVALRCARRWVMEKPALPSSWERITNTCLRREQGAQGQAIHRATERFRSEKTLKIIRSNR